MTAAYVATAQRRLAGLSQRSRHRAAMVDATVVQAALTAGDWLPERCLRTVTDVAVYTVRGPRGETGVLKVSATGSGMAGLRREHEVLRELAADERMGDWLAVLPVPLYAGEADGGVYLLTSRLPGQDGRELPPASASRLTQAAVEKIGPLHRRDQVVRRVDEALLYRWVDQPAERISRAVRSAPAIGRLAAALRADLVGQPVTLGWAHGDFHRGNLLAGVDGRVTGIVDWGEACAQDLPVLDIAFWLLTAPGPGQPREFGRRVAARLGSGQVWTPAEHRLLRSAAGRDLPAGRTLLLLAWLRHVGSNLAKSERYGGNPLWLRWNVLSVLRQMTHD